MECRGSMNFRLIAGIFVAILPALVAQERTGRNGAQEDFDIRMPSSSSAAVTDKVTVRDLRSRPGTKAKLTQTPEGRVKSLSSDIATLTGPSTKPREQVVRDFLKAESAVFSFLPQAKDRLRLLASDDSGGLAILNFQQHQAGLPIYEATLKGGLGRKGELIRIDGGGLTGNLSVNTTARLTAAQAIQAAYRLNGLGLPGAIGKAVARDGREFYPIAGGPEVAVERTLLAISAKAARLAYRMFIEAGPNADYEILIDARNGALLVRRNLVQRAGQGRIWKDSPLAGPRELVAFTDGWLPDNRLVTTGNNADAYVDANGNGVPDPDALAGLQNGRAFAASQVFDFPAPESPGLDPASFKPASVTNLFFLVNAAHDYFYSLGFTEAAGNFQADNFGRGGLGNDAVAARAQAGDAPNNASFATRPDGVVSIMRMGLWAGPTATADTRDSGYDGTIVFHEYTHGVSTRLVGGPANTGCLARLQSRAMGEGWSDYFASSYYNTPLTATYASQRVAGIRRQPYDTYTFTYEDLGNAGYEVHRDGEIWAAALFDMRTTLGSIEIADKLVVDGLKLTACNPSMVDARDGILQADQATNGGANINTLWTVFARHGLGYSARGADSAYRLSLVYSAFYLAAYDLPPGVGTGNQPPIISADAPPPAAALAVPFSYQVQAADPERGPLTYTLIAGPTGMSINSASGLLQWTPQFATSRVKVDVRDAQGARSVLGFVISVESPVAPGAGLSITGAQGSSAFATFDVPAGTQSVRIVADAVLGDPDLYIGDPNGTFIASEVRSGLIETSMISQPRAGRWTVAVGGFRAYQGNLAVSFPVVTPITSDAPETASGRISSQTIYKINVPPYSPQLVIQTSGGTGDVDIFAGRGYIPACETSATSVSAYCISDLRSARTGNTETITVNNPGPGDWYITLSAARDYADVNLVATHSAPPAGALLPSQSELLFYSTVGVPPTPQTFLVNADASIADFSWTGTVSSTGGWLQGRPATGQKGAVVTVSPVVAGLAAGTYRGTVNITSPGLAGSPRQVAVTLIIAPANTTLPVITSVVNGASFANGIAPGTWITIRGTSLSTTTRVWNGSDFNGTLLPTSLDNVRVKVNGKDALVYFISPTQINALAPDDVSTGPVPVTVTNGLGSTTVTAQLARSAPAFFQFDPANRRYAAAVLPDGTLCAPDGLFAGAVVTRPVAIGGRLLLYATGFGATDPVAPANRIVQGAPPLPADAGLVVTVGGVRATVEYAGLVSNGLYQFNIVIPNVADGDQPVVAQVDGVSTAGESLLRIGR
jgi:uncharacterized protein (TIGR03437 family)